MPLEEFGRNFSLKKDLSRMRRTLRELRPSKIQALELDWSLSDEDLANTLVHHRGSSLLFGIIEPEIVMRDLEDRGILKVLRQKGYKNFYSVNESHVQLEDRFVLLADHQDGSQGHTLFDIRTHKAELDWNGEPVETMIWNWISLQDPKGRFRESQKPLPGQEHPGLGVFRQCQELIISYVPLTKVELILAIPEHFHNAWLYSPSFTFFDPYFQGQFEGLTRDLLANLGLAHLSEALDRGEVIDDSGRAVAWTPHEQVCPMSERTKAHFLAPEYQVRKSASLAAHHYRWSPKR